MDRSGAILTFTARVHHLDRELDRLLASGFAIVEPESIPGFETLRIARFSDPERDQANLLVGS